MLDLSSGKTPQIHEDIIGSCILFSLWKDFTANGCKTVKSVAVSSRIGWKYQAGLLQTHHLQQQDRCPETQCHHPSGFYKCSRNTVGHIWIWQDFLMLLGPSVVSCRWRRDVPCQQRTRWVSDKKVPVIGEGWWSQGKLRVLT